MNNKDIQKKINAAYDLILQPDISFDNFQRCRVLLRGINPKLDKSLSSCADIASSLQKLQSGDIILLTAENLPENSEKEKKRKRLLLLFIENWNDLKQEVIRIKNEIENSSNSSAGERVTKTARIIKYAKGPFGMITGIAVILVAGTIMLQNAVIPVNTSSSIQTNKRAVYKVIEFNEKKIPLDELIVGNGPECDNSDHYHAKNHRDAKALDGTSVTDPGGCGYGKIKDVQVIELVE